MRGVEFLSSAGIGILARLSRRATRQDGTMSLFGVRDGVLKVLRLCDLETVFNVSDTLEDAHAHFD